MNDQIPIVFTPQELEYILALLEVRPHREVSSIIKSIHAQTRSAAMKVRVHPTNLEGPVLSQQASKGVGR